MILDFEPGIAVEPAQIRSVMVKAGYRPGPFEIQRVSKAEAMDNVPGWFKPPTVNSRWAFIRWLQINF